MVTHWLHNPEIAGLQDKPNHQKVNKEQPNDSIMKKLPTRTGNDRPKRPYRLLPPLSDELDSDGKRKGTTISLNPQFYGPPTGCSDLSLLGFTLNGFYQVKSNQTNRSNESTNSIWINNDTKLDTVFCAFKQPEGTSNPSLVEKRITSRRELKPSSGKVLYFHATRKTHLEAIVYQTFYISFDKVNVNLGNAFKATTGIFTVPKSGVYLFIFRGAVTFEQSRVGKSKEINIFYFCNDKKIGTSSVTDIKNNRLVIVELDKLVKVNRGDVIMVGAYIEGGGDIQFAANSTSFTGYLLEE